MDDSLFQLLSSDRNYEINNDVLNKFFYNTYYYYVKGGIYNIIVTKITDIFSLIFFGIFMLNVFVFFDWTNILKCGNTLETITDCGDIMKYISIKNFNENNLFQILIIIFTTGIFTFALYKILLFYSLCKDFYEVDHYYINTLKISRNELPSKRWKDIVAKISASENIPVDIIVNNIMKSENYFIALMQRDLFKIPNKYFTKQIEINLLYGLNSIKIYNKDVSSIKRRIIYLGILNLILSPFILIYNIISFIFSNIDELYINKKVLGPRRYTLYFKWKIRQYNELEHHFNHRLNRSLKHSIEYTKQFPSLFIENISKFILLLSGGFIVFFLLLSVLDENILLYVTFLNRSLIFYAGLCATISAFCKGFILEPENSAFNPDEVMNNIIKETYYDPGYWKNNGHKLNIRDEFLEYFKYIIILFMYDILSVVMTPYLLIFVVSRQANIIHSFLKHNTTYKKNIGNICTFSDFKRKTENQSIENNEKLENSILCFSGNYPDWNFN